MRTVHNDSQRLSSGVEQGWPFQVGRVNDGMPPKHQLLELLAFRKVQAFARAPNNASFNGRLMVSKWLASHGAAA